MATKRQLQIVENFIQKETKRLMKEESGNLEKKLAKSIFVGLKNNKSIQAGELAFLSYEIADIVMRFLKTEKIV